MRTIAAALVLTIVACSSSEGGGADGFVEPIAGCSAIPDCAACATCEERCRCVGSPDDALCMTLCSGVGGTGGFVGTGGTGALIGLGGQGQGGMQGCASASVQSDLLPANILFLVDRSGSMNCNLPPIQDQRACEMAPMPVDAMAPTKWDVIKDTLKRALPQLPQGARAGITYFSNNDVCGVQSFANVPLLPVDPAHVASLEASLDMVTPKGPTPIIGATILGFKHLHEQAQLPGNNFIVLITDGEDTCDPAETNRLLFEEIPKARGVNIRVFAIGAPGSENGRRLLSNIAWEGGTPRDPSCDHSDTAADQGDCHFDMTQTTDLAADLGRALTEISGAALSCELTVPEASGGAAVDPEKVNVSYFPGGGGTEMPVLQDTTAECDAGAEGWQYLDGNAKIRLCGSICDTVKADPQARVEIVLGCETMRVF